MPGVTVCVCCNLSLGLCAFVSACVYECVSVCLCVCVSGCVPVRVYVCPLVHVLTAAVLLSLPPHGHTCSDSDASVKSEELPEETRVRTAIDGDIGQLRIGNRGAPAGLEGCTPGQTLRRCVRQGWLYKRGEGGLFNQYVSVGRCRLACRVA